MLYVLWDLKLKVGQSTRSIDDCLRLGAGDITKWAAGLAKAVTAERERAAA